MYLFIELMNNMVDKATLNLPELLVACIQAASCSGKQLSWTIKENAKGTLVQLVWKIDPELQNLSGPEKVSSIKNSSIQNSSTSQKRRKKASPSRLKRSQERLQCFLSRKIAQSHIKTAGTMPDGSSLGSYGQET